MYGDYYEIYKQVLLQVLETLKLDIRWRVFIVDTMRGIDAHNNKFIKHNINAKVDYIIAYNCITSLKEKRQIKKYVTAIVETTKEIMKKEGLI